TNVQHAIFKEQIRSHRLRITPVLGSRCSISGTLLPISGIALSMLGLLNSFFARRWAYFSDFSSAFLVISTRSSTAGVSHINPAINYPICFAIWIWLLHGLPCSLLQWTLFCFPDPRLRPGFQQHHQS